jgi:hypothetical protein
MRVPQWKFGRITPLGIHPEAAISSSGSPTVHPEPQIPVTGPRGARREFANYINARQRATPSGVNDNCQHHWTTRCSPVCIHALAEARIACDTAQRWTPFQTGI